MTKARIGFSPVVQRTPSRAFLLACLTGFVVVATPWAESTRASGATKTIKESKTAASSRIGKKAKATPPASKKVVYKMVTSVAYEAVKDFDVEKGPDLRVVEKSKVTFSAERSDLTVELFTDEKGRTTWQVDGVSADSNGTNKYVSGVATARTSRTEYIKNIKSGGDGTIEDTADLSAFSVYFTVLAPRPSPLQTGDEVRVSLSAEMFGPALRRASSGTKTDEQTRTIRKLTIGEEGPQFDAQTPSPWILINPAIPGAPPATEDARAWFALYAGELAMWRPFTNVVVNDRPPCIDYSASRTRKTDALQLETLTETLKLRFCWKK